MSRKHLAMIQRMFNAPFRVAGASIRRAPRSNLLQPLCRNSKPSVFQRLRPASAARTYATEPEQRTASEGESQINGQAQMESEVTDDAAKRELDAKNKEIVDLKVCQPCICHSQSNSKQN